jgi:integrase
LFLKGLFAAAASAILPMSQKTKICMNPACKKPFVPGHYKDRQLVGSSLEHFTIEACKPCHGSGKKNGTVCQKCSGKKSLKQTCAEWYRSYWSQIRKPPRGIPENDQRRALEAVEKKDVRYWSLLVAARNSALRKGELLGLTWGDIEDGGEIRSNFPLRGQWSDKEGFKATKTDAGRIAYFFEEVRKALKKMRGAAAKNDGPADRVWPYSEAETWARWIRIQKQLKIVNPETKREYRFHDWRHVSALRTLKRTGKLSDATVLCGHKNPATTLIYTQQRPEDFVASIEGKGKK